MTKRVQILEEEEENGEGGYFDEGDDEDDYYEGYANEYDRSNVNVNYSKQKDSKPKGSKPSK
jgi:hypothetical protein